MDEPNYEQISADFPSSVVDTKEETLYDSCLFLMISFMNGSPCPISATNLKPFKKHYSLYSILGWKTHLNLYCLTCILYQFVLVLHFSYMMFSLSKKINISTSFYTYLPQTLSYIFGIFQNIWALR